MNVEAPVLFTLKVPVAMRFATETLPEKRPLPWTPSEKFDDGEVVPSPRIPEELITEGRAPDVLYISRMLAVWLAVGTSARVVVALEPETTESIAYGVVVAPMPTM